MMMNNAAPNPTTTDAGIPVPSDEHSLTIGPDGPILLQDHYLIEQMANFNRERIPSVSHMPRALERSATSR
jgi:catalase